MEAVLGDVPLLRGEHAVLYNMLMAPIHQREV
jgi:hypothetical protein